MLRVAPSRNIDLLTFCIFFVSIAFIDNQWNNPEKYHISITPIAQSLLTSCPTIAHYPASGIAGKLRNNC